MSPLNTSSFDSLFSVLSVYLLPSVVTASVVFSSEVVDDVDDSDAVETLVVLLVLVQLVEVPLNNSVSSSLLHNMEAYLFDLT